MSLQVTSRLEINLLNSTTKPDYITEFVLRNGVPAVVASPEYIAPLVALRAIRGGAYKIVCALDFPGGTNFGMDKMLRAHPDFVAADGFDILLSVGRHDIETHNEMMSIYKFLKSNRPISDIRWTLKPHTNLQETKNALNHIMKYPPSFVRLGSELTEPNLDIESHKKYIKLVREKIPYPLKVCGNIDLEAFNELSKEVNAKRFDVSLEQAEAIVRELAKLPRAATTTPKPGPTSNTSAVKKVGNVGRIRI